MGHGARFAQDHPRGPRMGSLKSPCRTSYRSSLETTAVNCVVFEKTEFLCTVGISCDRQTWTAPSREAAA